MGRGLVFLLADSFQYPSDAAACCSWLCSFRLVPVSSVKDGSIRSWTLSLPTISGSSHSVQMSGGAQRQVET